MESSVSREAESLGDMSIGRLWWLWLVTGIVWIIASDGLFAVLTERLGL